MSNYSEIKGVQVQTLSSDPSNPLDGQVWFNSTTGKIKASYISTVGSWASGAALGTARNRSAGCGTQTAALCMGGDTGPATKSALTEHFDGSSWTSGGNLGTGRSQVRGTGTQTAALFVCGFPTTTACEEYNGSSWTAGGAYPQAFKNVGAAGTQTAGLAFGGNTTNATNEYNGTSWTAGGTMPYSADRNGCVGIQTAALTFGGWTGSRSQITAHYDGSSWTTGGNLIVGKHAMGCLGTQTSAMSAGGNHASSPNNSSVEIYDGSSWTSDTSLPNSFSDGQGAGSSTTTAGQIFGGISPNPNNYAFAGPGVVTETISSS